MSATAELVAPTPGLEAPPQARRRRIRIGRVLLPAYTWLVILYTIIPIAVMVVYSFNQTSSGKMTFHWNGFTTAWYGEAFNISDLTNALVHSLEIAVASTVIAIIIATPLALALARYRFHGRLVTEAAVFTDIAAPSVIVGASMLSMFITLGIPRGLVTILIAHVTFNVAFAVIVIRARVVALDRSIERAAYDLGAGPWTTFQKVILPLTLPGIVAAALLAFAMSIDDFIITSFVAGQTLTFPLWVFGAVKVGIPPQVFVLGTLIFAAGVLLALLNVFLQRHTEVTNR